MVDPEFVPIAAYRDVLDAELAVSTLAAAGIDAQLVDENTVGVAWTYSVAVGGVKVMVPKPEVDAAREILESDQSSELDAVLGAGNESERTEQCPRCGSSESKTYKLARPAAAAAILTGLPFVLWGERNQCRKCGRIWKPSRV